MTPPNEPEVIALMRDYMKLNAPNHNGMLLHNNDVTSALAAYDELRAERDAAVRELEETRKREALSDAIVDACDSDITMLMKERATLRAERDAAVRERDEARDKNVELHNLVRKYKNKATKQSQKQKKNYKLAKYADESNATIRARLAACESSLREWRVWGDNAASGHPDAPMASLDHEVRAVIENRYGFRAAVAAETQGTPHAGGTDA